MNIEKMKTNFHELKITFNGLPVFLKKLKKQMMLYSFK